MRITRTLLAAGAAGLMAITTGIVASPPAYAASCSYTLSATRDQHYPPGSCRLYLSRSSVPAGGLVSFVGYGFRQGEKVNIALYPGHTVVGATTAYRSTGKIAGTIRIPRDRTPGKTVIGAYGTASGRFLTARITVTSP